MANANIDSVRLILDTPLWAGQGGITKLSQSGASNNPTVLNAGDTSWLQAPIGSGNPTTTANLAILEITCTASNQATNYDLTVATNPLISNKLADGVTEDFELIAVLGHYNFTTAAGRMAEGDHTPTMIKFAADAQMQAADKYRVVLMYHRRAE
tara:strand:+ start:3460 stop:3921 length:462 start_codon:yes stop_codon:yes gene_type:complete